jgi:hypothetical protein
MYNQIRMANTLERTLKKGDAMQHILIDFENIQPEAKQLAALDENNCHIWLFLGKLQQKTLSIDLCEALCRFGKNVHFVRIAKTGKNALDFYLAYYLGKISEQDKDALICIFSRDTGFDVLVEHMESGQHCRGIVRIATLADAAPLPQTEIATPAIQAADEAVVPTAIAATADKETTAPLPPQNNSAIVHDLYKKAQQYLMQPDSFRPRGRDNLENLLCKYLCESLQIYAESDAKAAIHKAVDKLITKTLITLDGNGLLNYHLDPQSMQQKIITHITAAKAGKTDGLKNTIRTKSVSLGLDSDDAAIEKCIVYCEKNGILRREGDKVLYPPFANTENQPALNILEEKAKLFFSKFRQNKPTKRASLMTVCQHLLKLDTAQTEAMIRYLVAHNKLQIVETGTLTWLQ